MKKYPMNDAMLKALAYTAARLKEPSTYPALVLILIAFGRLITPEQENAIMIAGLFLAGLIGAILPDRMKSQTRSDDPQPPKAANESETKT